MEIGLSEVKAKETAKNAKVASNLVKIIEQAKSVQSAQTLSSVGTLLYHVASKTKPQIFKHAPFIVDYIMQGKIDSEVRVNAALDYFIKNQDDKVLIS